MSSTQDAAEAFSSHRFRDVYDRLAPDVVWVLVGDSVLRGRDAVVAACEATLAELGDGTTEFTRFRSVADDRTAAVDVVGRYTAPDGGVTVVASCDIYETTDGSIVRITSYTVELDAGQDEAQPA